mgnify:CR=1 FL=1
MSRSSPYGAKWQAARVVYLAEHPCCAMCAQRGVVAAATVVDHVVPHRGDMALFWRRSNWQPLCKPCHDRHKQRSERGGGVVGCDAGGMPLDAAHPWHQGGGG